MAEVLLPIAGPDAHLAESRAPAETLLASGDVRTPRRGRAASRRSLRGRGSHGAREPSCSTSRCWGSASRRASRRSLWVHAADASRAPLAGVTVEPQAEPGFLPADADVDDRCARGWAHVAATPVGAAVDVQLKAQRAGRTRGRMVRCALRLARRRALASTSA